MHGSMLAAGGNQASRLSRAAQAPPADPTATRADESPRIRQLRNRRPSPMEDHPDGPAFPREHGAVNVRLESLRALLCRLPREQRRAPWFARKPSTCHLGVLARLLRTIWPEQQCAPDSSWLVQPAMRGRDPASRRRWCCDARSLPPASVTSHDARIIRMGRGRAAVGGEAAGGSSTTARAGEKRARPRPEPLRARSRSSRQSERRS